MSIIVTGGLGLIGLETIRELKKAFATKIYCVDYKAQLKRLTDETHFSRRYIDNLLETIALVNDFVEPEEAFGLNAEMVVHLGATVDTLGDAELLMQNNVEYTRRLAKQFAAKRFIFGSSAAVYGVHGRHPANVYGLTKSLGEKIVNAMTHHATCLRFFNVYGAFEHHKGAMASMPFKAARAYVKGDTYELFAPEAARDFIHVKDVAKAIVGCLAGPPTLGTHDIGTGRPVSFEQMDSFVRQAANGTTTRARFISFPSHLVGKYQMMTKANLMKGNPLLPSKMLVQPLEYGVRDLITTMREDVNS